MYGSKIYVTLFMVNRSLRFNVLMNIKFRNSEFEQFRSNQMIDIDDDSILCQFGSSECSKIDCFTSVNFFTRTRQLIK